MYDAFQQLLAQDNPDMPLIYALDYTKFKRRFTVWLVGYAHTFLEHFNRYINQTIRSSI